MLLLYTLPLLFYFYRLNFQDTVSRSWRHLGTHGPKPIRGCISFSSHWVVDPVLKKKSRPTFESGFSLRSGLYYKGVPLVWEKWWTLSLLLVWHIGNVVSYSSVLLLFLLLLQLPEFFFSSLLNLYITLNSCVVARQCSTLAIYRITYRRDF